jgi:hypothetical protein
VPALRADRVVPEGADGEKIGSLLRNSDTVAAYQTNTPTKMIVA